MHLLVKVVRRQAGNPWKRTAADGTCVVALGAGGDAGRHAVSCNGGSSAGVGPADRRLCDRMRNPCGADARAGCGREGPAEDAAPAHACTNGPGAFRNLFLIASNAQYVSAPIVTL